MIAMNPSSSNYFKIKEELKKPNENPLHLPKRGMRK